MLNQQIAYAVCEHNAKFPDLIFHVNGGNPKKKQKKNPKEDTNLVDTHI